MFDTLNEAIDTYWVTWQELVSHRKNKEFFERLKPMSVGWKTTDLAEYEKLFDELRDSCDQMHMAWLNNRWLATLHLKDAKLHHGIELIKLMQRRPNSTDAVGLDHLDFLDMEQTNTKAVLTEETDLTWTDEKNGLCVWTSIWFSNTEAKLRSETVLDVAIAELLQVNNKLRGEKFKIVSEGTGVYASEIE